MELCVSKNKNINSKIFYLVFGYFSTNTSRAFGTRKLVESDLQLMSKVCLFLNGVFRISWGFVYDRFGFKIPYTIITALQIITSISFYFSANYLWSYYITNLLENIVFAGHGTIAPPIVSKIFGMKNTVKLIGITGYYIGTAAFLGAVIGKIIIDDDSDFLIVYLIGAGFAIMGFVICLIMKEDKIEYTPNEELLDDNKEKNEESELIKPSIGSATE